MRDFEQGHGPIKKDWRCAVMNRAKIRVGISGLVSLVLVLSPGYSAKPAYAEPPAPPHAFYGGLTINGEPAPVGAVVEARVDGVLAGVITTTVEGQYGGSQLGEEKLVVQGDIPPDAPIRFWVNGADTGQTYPFQSGAITSLDLSLEVQPGDANMDARLNSLDITRIERIIAGLDDPTAGADANQDGSIDVRDITQLERFIAGLD